MESSEIDIRGILSVLRRQFRLILVTFVLIVSIAAIAAFILRPIYSAGTLILVDNMQGNLLDSTDQLMGGPDSARVESEVEILRSSTILLDVIQSESLLTDPEFGVSLGLRDRLLSLLRIREPQLATGEEALQQTMTKLRAAVSVERRGLTYLMQVSVRSARPEAAANLANAIATAYVKDQIASKIATITSARDLLQQQIAASREAMIQSDGAFDAYVQQNIDRIASESGRTDLQTIQRQIEELQDVRDNTNALADQVEAQLAQSDWSDLVASLESDALTELERQRTELQASLATETAGTPSEINLRQALSEVEQSLRTAASTEVSNLRTQVANAEDNENTLRQQLRQQVFSSGVSADVLANVYELRQNSELATQRYQTLLARVQDLDAQANIQIANSRIVSPAMTPSAPAFPNRVLIILGASVLALVLGVILSFLYENFIGGFVSDDQLASVLKIRVAGAVPKVKEGSGGHSLADVALRSPLSPFAESIRRVRAAVDQATGAFSDQPLSKGVVIMMSSTAPYEGKSTTSLALARSYAGSGRRVLLIDCDLRKPSLQRHINVEPILGLRDFLSGEGDLIPFADCIVKDPETSATLILATRKSSLPTDQLLASAKFQALIAAARTTFDIVILDTAPIGPVVDGLYIAPFADAIVFLTRWASTSQIDVRKAIASLNQSKRPETEIIGVLTQQDAPRSAYLKKYGGYYQEAAS